MQISLAPFDDLGTIVHLLNLCPLPRRCKGVEELGPVSVCSTIWPRNVSHERVGEYSDSDTCVFIGEV